MGNRIKAQSVGFRIMNVVLTLILLLSLVMAEFPFQTVLAAEPSSTVVTTANDTVADDGVISLREAINNAQDGGVVTFDEALFDDGNGGFKGITITLEQREIEFSKELSIIGPEDTEMPAVTISGNNDNRILNHRGDGKLKLCGINFEDGRNYEDGGGGVYTENGDIILENCHFIHNQGPYGGGVCAQNGNIRMTKCIFEQNTSYYGGAAYTGTGDIHMTNCDILLNAALYEGGGVCSGNGIMAVNCMIFGNNTDTGSSGAVTAKSKITLLHTTVAGNHGGTGLHLKANGKLNLWNTIVAGNDGGSFAGTYKGRSLVEGMMDPEQSQIVTSEAIFGSNTPDEEGRLRVKPGGLADDTATALTAEDLINADITDETEQKDILAALKADLSGIARAGSGKVTYGALEIPIDSNILYILIEEYPDKLDYIYGEELDLTGGSIRVVYKNPDMESVILSMEDPSITTSGMPSVGKDLEVTVYYMGHEATFTVNVAQKEIAVTGLSVSDKVYDGTKAAEVAGAAVLVGVLEDDEVWLESYTAEFEDKHAKEDKTVYLIDFELRGDQADRYRLDKPARLDSTATIFKAPTYLNLKASREQEGTEVTLTVAVGGFLSEDVPSGKVSFTYTLSGEDRKTVEALVQPDGNAVYTLPNLKAGTYEIMAAFKSGNSNYKDSKTERAILYDVNKDDQLPFNIIGENEKTYGDDPFELTADGGSGDGKVTWSSSNHDVATVDENGKVTITGAGETTITATKAGDDIYNEASDSIQLTVNQKPVAIEPAAGQSKIYGDPDPILTFDNDGGLEDSDFSGALKWGAGENAGSYAIELGTLSAGGNYSLSLSASVDFIIARAPLTVKAEDKTVKQGYMLPQITISYVGFKRGDTAESTFLIQPVAVHKAVNTNTPGRYGIEFTTEAKQIHMNYNITYEKGTLTVTKTETGTEEKEHTVTFESDGSGSAVIWYVKDGETITEPKAPQRPGYTFTGWYTDKECTIRYDFTTPVTGNLTLYAGWRKAVRTIKPYVAGYPDGSFRPNGPITRAEVAQMLYNLLDAENIAYSSGKASSIKFSDVESGAWYYDAVTQLASDGIISGYPQGIYRPNASITRAEFTTLVVKYMDVKYRVDESFRDVSVKHWAKGFIYTAKAEGLVNGYPDGNFGPQDDITRAQVVVIINNMIKRGTDPSIFKGIKMPFSDVLETHWAYWQIMAAAVKHTV